MLEDCSHWKVHVDSVTVRQHAHRLRGRKYWFLSFLTESVLITYTSAKTESTSYSILHFVDPETVVLH